MIHKKYFLSCLTYILVKLKKILNLKFHLIYKSIFANKYYHNILTISKHNLLAK